MILHYPSVLKPEPCMTTWSSVLISPLPVLDFAEASTSGLKLHGRSLVPLLEKRADSWRESFLVEYYSDTVFGRMRSMGYRAVRTGRYKYIRYTALSGMDELYDLETDPYELRNLINDSDQGSVLANMQAELDRLLFSMR